MDRAKKANKQVNEILRVFQKGNITDDESLAYVSKISMYENMHVCENRVFKNICFLSMNVFFFEIQESKIWSFKLTLLKPKLIIYLDVKLLY